jgi:Protein of unknown function (DUF3102)
MSTTAIEVTDSLEVLAAKIRELSEVTITYLIEMGRLLTAAKALCPHGEWSSWLEREFEWKSHRTATRLIQVFELSQTKLATVTNLETLAFGVLYAVAESPPEIAEGLLERSAAGEPITLPKVQQAREEGRHSDAYWRKKEQFLRDQRAAADKHRDEWLRNGMKTPMPQYNEPPSPPPEPVEDKPARKPRAKSADSVGTSRRMESIEERAGRPAPTEEQPPAHAGGRVEAEPVDHVHEITECAETLRAMEVRLAGFSWPGFHDALTEATQALEGWLAMIAKRNEARDKKAASAPPVGRPTPAPVSAPEAALAAPAAQDEAGEPDGQLPPPIGGFSAAALAKMSASLASEPASDHATRVTEGRKKAAATRAATIERKRLHALDTAEAKKTRTDDARKIGKLKNMTEDRGATPGEAEAALAATATLKGKVDPLKAFLPEPLPATAEEMLWRRDAVTVKRAAKRAAKESAGQKAAREEDERAARVELDRSAWLAKQGDDGAK